MRKAIAAGLVSLVLGGAIATAAHASQSTQSDLTDSSMDTASYEQWGSHAVGTLDLVIDDGNARPLEATVWYPAISSDKREAAHTYSIDYPPVFPGWSVEGRAISNAVPDRTEAPYPLVVFVHGSSHMRLASVFLTEHLASHGFVVIAVDYEDNAGAQTTNAYRSYFSRPIDVARQIDFAEEYTVGDPIMAGMIDTEHVAVTGHSLGGYTALAVSGGQFDIEQLRSQVDSNPELGSSRWSAVNAYIQELLGQTSRDKLAERLAALFVDPRIDAVVPLAPAGHYFGSDGLAAVDLPVMILGGSDDMATTPEANFYVPYEVLSSAHKALVVFEGAGHMIFVNGCAEMHGSSVEDYSWLCSDPVWDLDRAHALINHFVTAFLRHELCDDEAATEALQPDSVDFGAISYLSAQ